jgi:DNA replication and repair protein RecF
VSPPIEYAAPAASATQALTLDRLAVRHLRNLTHVDLELGPRFNVISGDNGQGKTNLIDAVYTLATSKSFRSSGRPEDVIAHGESVASVRGTLTLGGLAHEQSVGLEKGRRAVRVDGKRPKTLFEYASRTPVVVFHPGDTALPAGSGAERRRLLDRILFHLRPAAWEELDSYRRASRERQRALDERGPQARDLPDWEALMVRHGLAIRLMRTDAASRVALAAAPVFRSIARGEAIFHAAYEPGAPEDERTYADALAQSRVIDARRGSARVGPHRDDLGLYIDGKRVRGIASQGQHRLVVLALKAGEIAVIGSVRGVHPLLLLDDVSSELDEGRTTALFELIGGWDGQVFLTTTRRSLIDTGSSPGADRRDFEVVRGSVRPR